MKFCQDCRHKGKDKGRDGYGECHSPSNMSNPSLVTGERYAIHSMSSYRRVGGACGPEANLFVPATPAQKIIRFLRID